MTVKKRKRLQTSLGIGSLLNSIQPLISMTVLTTGLIVWAYNNFAQITYVKEQNAALMAHIEQTRRDLIIYSDQNRERIIGILMEVKDSVKSLESRLLVPIGANPR